jgi:hypothetical protein
VNVIGFKACLGEGVGHLHMRVHALLSQHRHAWASLVHKSGDGLVQPASR